MRIEFTREQRTRVDNARDELQAITMQVLKEQNLDYMDIDLTEAAESIALEGYLVDSHDPADIES